MEEAKPKIVPALFPSMEGSRRDKAVVAASSSISSELLKLSKPYPHCGWNLFCILEIIPYIGRETSGIHPPDGVLGNPLALIRFQATPSLSHPRCKALPAIFPWDMVGLG